MFNLIIGTLLVSITAYLFTSRLFRIHVFAEFVLVWFVLFLAQIILAELSLGVIGKLYLPYVFLTYLIFFLIALLFLRNKRGVDIIKPDIGILLSSKLLLLAFSVFVCFFSVKFFINLINPPISPDSLQYHLAFPASWIRSGNLSNPFCIFGSIPTIFAKSLELSSVSYYPINAQLFFTWLMMPLKNAFLADVGEVPFYLIGIITISVILDKYRVKKEIAILSGFLWVLIPNIFKQLKTGSQIDVICATLFLLMIYTVLLLKENFSFKYAALFGISTGLFLGTKVTNIIWFIAALPFIAYLFYRSLRAYRVGLAKLFLMLSSIIFMVLLFGGFTYFRNLIFTGNPFFPIDVRLFGKVIFKGLMDNITYKTYMIYGDKFDLTKILFSEGLGVQFLALFLPGILVPFIFYKQMSAKAKPMWEYLLLFLTPIMMIILYGFFVNVYVVRYLFPYFSMGLVTAVIFISLLPYGERYFFSVSFLAILVSAFELAHRQELIVSLCLSIILFVTLSIFNKQIVIFCKNRIFYIVLICFLVLGVLFLGYLNIKYNNEEYERYPLTFSKKEAWQIDVTKGWKKLNEITGKGERIAYTGRLEFYPLFGSGLKNDVQYISVNEKQISPYNNPNGLYRKDKIFNEWRENLRNNKIGYLFITLPFFDNKETSNPDKFPIEDDWASEHPQLFKLLFKNSLVHIYLVDLKE